MSGNIITPLLNESVGNSDLLSSTLLMSFIGVVFGLVYLKQQLTLLDTKKQDKSQEDILEEDFYQCWEGNFADGEDSLLIHIVRKKYTKKSKNMAWIQWDGSEDGSVITRNFYLGNQNPSFDWSITKREEDTLASVQEMLTDGWDCVVQIKLTAFMKEEKTNSEMNEFLRTLLINDKIEWEKSLLRIEGGYDQLFT